jgi:hypothetical protein
MNGFAYDAARDQPLLFGGTAGGQPLGDTWRCAEPRRCDETRLAASPSCG